MQVLTIVIYNTCVRYLQKRPTLTIRCQCGFVSELENTSQPFPSGLNSGHLWNTALTYGVKHPQSYWRSTTLCQTSLPYRRSVGVYVWTNLPPLFQYLQLLVGKQWIEQFIPPLYFIQNICTYFYKSNFKPLMNKFPLTFFSCRCFIKKTFVKNKLNLLYYLNLMLSVIMML